MNPPRELRPALLCFAVPQEAAPFRRKCPADVEVLITGMGRSNAVWKVQAHLANLRPGLVVTAGFAGALDPTLRTGDVLFDADPESSLEGRLRDAGARPGRIHCSERVAITAGEKSVLLASTQADAVEMESGGIRALCLERGIPSVTVRVISDTATEDLPIDFNRLMTPDGRLRVPALAVAILCSPRRIAGLIRLGRNSTRAAEALAAVLAACLAR